MNDVSDTSRLGRATRLALVQRPAQERTYALRRDDQVVGSLRFPAGQRSPALAAGEHEPAFTS